MLLYLLLVNTDDAIAKMDYSDDGSDDVYPLEEAEELIIKTFSVGSLAQQALVRSGANILAGCIDPVQEEEHRELIRNRIFCRQQLLAMKARNAEPISNDDDSEGTGRTVIQQEDLQEWLDNLQLKLNQACISASHPATRRSRAKRVQNNYSSGESRLKSVVPGSSGHARTSRSVNAMFDQAAAALTDGQYIERLQSALQQASVSSLNERLTERKMASISTLQQTLQSTSCATSQAAVRPKTTVTGNKSRSKTRTPQQSGKGTQPTPKPVKVTVPQSGDSSKSNTSSIKTKSIKSKSIKSSSKNHREELDSAESTASRSTLSPNQNLLMGVQHQQNDHQLSPRIPHSLPEAVRNRSAFSKSILDYGQQKVEDIYLAAEHLILPPNRRETSQSESSGPAQYDTLKLLYQTPLEEEELEVEDFWGAAD